MNFSQDLNKFMVSQGISSNTLDSYQKMQNAYLSPHVIEERPLNITSIDVFSRLMMDRTLFLGSEINDDVANIITAQLLFLEQQGDGDINLYINSPGGSVSDGLAIYDCMQFIKPEVSTTVIGTAASMGAVLACGGEKGKRFMLPHARFMIHQPMSGIAPHTQASDILISAEQIKICRDELYEILAEHSNCDIAKITEMADRDCWLRASQAIEYGFMDKVVSKQ